MQKLIAALSWGLIGGVVAFFIATNFWPEVAFSSATKPAKKATAGTTAKVEAVKKPVLKKKSEVSEKKSVVAASSAERRELPPILVGLYIFVLAIFVGFELISKVPPILHTPLMSGANAISGITIVGALFCARSSVATIPAILGLVAVIAAMINVIGGFLVTDRMLQMFKR